MRICWGKLFQEFSASEVPSFNGSVLTAEAAAAGSNGLSANGTGAGAPKLERLDARESSKTSSLESKPAATAL